MDEKSILANVANLSAEQLFEEINKGAITLDKLIHSGELDLFKKKRITELINANAGKDDEAWENARYGNESSLRDYIYKFPAGNHIDEAKRKICELEDIRRRAMEDKADLLEKIRRNSNKVSPDIIKTRLQQRIITKDDLLDCGVPSEVVDVLDNIQRPRLDLGITPDKIPDGFTEVYFWGIPGSGKTCALAALLSTIERAGFLNITTGPGYDYMTRLKNLFLRVPSFLPPPSPFDTTQYLPFVMKKPDEKFGRSVSLIEMSGEIFKCFYFINAGQSMPSQLHDDTFKTLKSYLMSDNRKMHFFFIDYDKSNEMDDEGYTQSDYLNAAATFFRQNKVFGKTTDAIYIVLTKTDLMPCDPAERQEQAVQHLHDQNFMSFVNVLKDNCKTYSINGGRLIVEPFSLGSVYFRNICEFEGRTAEKLMNILIERIQPSRKSILDILNN